VIQIPSHSVLSILIDDRTIFRDILASIELEKGISHGYSYDGSLIPYAWDAFGGESWLVELAYAGGTGQVAPLAYPSPPTANGSGFTDELAWLFVPPPVKQDYWGTDWISYRTAAVEKQIAYYPSNYSAFCFAQLGLFGLSAGERRDPPDSSCHSDSCQSRDHT